MMHYGIPAYRLPREGLDKEIARIERLGVRFERNHRVTDVQAEKAAGSFDAVFLAIGAHLSQPPRHPGDGRRSAIIDAVTLMERRREGPRPLARRDRGGLRRRQHRDGCRPHGARRLGAEEAVIIFRFDKAQMDAHEEEAEDALPKA